MGGDFCAEREFFSLVILFHRFIHKYTRVARGRDGVEVKSGTDFVLLKRDMLKYV